MLYSLNGTAFSFLSNTDKGSIPVLRTNPLAIYGNNLVYWFDFTDTSTLFTNTGATINVSNYGDPIRAVRSKSSYNQLILNTSATLSYLYSAVPQYNSYGGVYRTGATSPSTEQYFETGNSLLTGNTLMGVHMVFRNPNQPTTQESRIFQIGQFNLNGLLYLNKDGANKLVFVNQGNAGPDIRGATASRPLAIPDRWSATTITIFSLLINFSTVTNTSLYGMPVNSYRDIYNNNYEGDISYGATVMSIFRASPISTNKLRLFGSNTTSQAQPVPGFFMQEFFMTRFDDDDVKFQAAHQYLRQKYLS